MKMTPKSHVYGNGKSPIFLMTSSGPVRLIRGFEFFLSLGVLLIKKSSVYDEFLGATLSPKPNWVALCNGLILINKLKYEFSY